MTAQDKALRSWGWTPLHHAALHNHMDMVKLLLSHGADVNATDRLNPRSTALPNSPCLHKCVHILSQIAESWYKHVFQELQALSFEVVVQTVSTIQQPSACCFSLFRPATCLGPIFATLRRHRTASSCTQYQQLHPKVMHNMRYPMAMHMNTHLGKTLHDADAGCNAACCDCMLQPRATH